VNEGTKRRIGKAKVTDVLLLLLQERIALDDGQLFVNVYIEDERPLLPALCAANSRTGFPMNRASGARLKNVVSQ
jgi:hypothetical protein